MRMTKNKRLILEALRAVDDDEALESGQAPYNAADVVKKTNSEQSNVARTLREMERQSLVIAEYKYQDVWTDLKNQMHVQKKLKCYWTVATLSEDKARAQQWRDGAQQRSERAMSSMVEVFLS